MMKQEKRKAELESNPRKREFNGTAWISGAEEGIDLESVAADKGYGYYAKGSGKRKGLFKPTKG